MLPYRTLDEVIERMFSSIVMYDDQPVYVHDCKLKAETIYCSFTYLPVKMVHGEVKGDKVGKASIDDDKWNISNYTLGYINMRKRGIDSWIAAYVTRVPIRGAGGLYKQGLTEATMMIPAELGLFSNLISNICFKNMMLGKYPNVRTVLKTLNEAEEPSTCAFHRRFAIEKSELDMYWLHYRGKRVASSYDGKEWKLPIDLSFLQELLDENGIKVTQ